jgi:hypothetical protein
MENFADRIEWSVVLPFDRDRPTHDASPRRDRLSRRDRQAQCVRGCLRQVRVQGSLCGRAFDRATRTRCQSDRLARRADYDAVSEPTYLSCTSRSPVGHSQASVGVCVRALEQHLAVDDNHAGRSEPARRCAADAGQFVRADRRSIGHPQAIVDARVSAIEQNLAVRQNFVATYETAAGTRFRRNRPNAYASAKFQNPRSY